MKTWDDWSDKEICFAVTAKINDVDGWSLTKDESEFYHCGPDGMSYYSVAVIDINNPADMWPIIVDNRITITPYQDESQGWFATTDTSFFVDDINPLRAAAIVFLMMNGVNP